MSTTDSHGSLSARSSFSDLPDVFKISIEDRIYNKSTKYLLPCDPDEVDRQNLEHYVFRQLIHGNFNAPIETELERGIKVLDAGCGSGQWILEMARDYPSSSFVGIDAAEIFPTGVDIPPNCTFLKADTLKGLPFEDSSFDYVFQRFALFAFTPSDWTVAIRELVRVMAPGGWIECFEISMKLERPPPGYNVFGDAIEELARSKGIDIDYIWEIGNLLQSADIGNIKSDYVSCPIGWGGRVGDLQSANARLVTIALGPLIAPAMGMDNMEFVQKVNALIDNYQLHKTWQKAPYFYGQKPLDGLLGGYGYGTYSF